MKATSDGKLGRANQGLAEKGLLFLEERSDATHLSSEFYWRDFTDLGIEVASLLATNGAKPDWLADEM